VPPPLARGGFRSPVEHRTVALHLSGAARHLPYRGGYARPEASPGKGGPRKAGFLAQPEGTRANCFSACFSRRPRQGDNLPERVKANGNTDACHSHCVTKATEPYGIAEVPRRTSRRRGFSDRARLARPTCRAVVRFSAANLLSRPAARRGKPP
jgi:hypothetical protein